ncbi:MAG: UvrD-helicase domain-containing protein, partial [Gammaproteobacteria bacterium]|nr:UvrD-helicase domain-containing protein [Gammaproteobacteria bacterium]
MTDSLASQDDRAREEAIAPASILLEAPAGSGKTAILTERFLRLLTTVAEPGEILAITFTRKAAAEMRARIVRALAGEVRPGDPHDARLAPLAAAALEHGARRGWRIATDPQTLRIQTIDSFNYWLASQLPIAARVGGPLTISESPEELYRRAARQTLLAAESDAALAPHAELLFERCDNQWLRLEGLIAQMLRERGHWLRFVAGEDPQRLCEQVNATLTALARARLAALRAQVPEALRMRAEALAGGIRLGAEPGDVPAWKAFSRLVLTQGGDWRRQVTSRLGTAFAVRAGRERLRRLIEELQAIPGAREALLSVRRAPGARLSAADEAAMAALSRVLAHAAAELSLEFARSHRVDHTYVAGAARAALAAGGEPTDLALRTGLALRHLLVDEFQDTSLAQYQLLELLTAGWEEGDGRTLFVVGDPMQSIYRFRDAEVGLFLRAGTRGIGQVHLKRLRLVRNFRAAPELVAFVNDLFGQVFPASDDLRTGGVRCRPSLAARPAATAPAGVEPLTLRLFPAAPRAEAEAIAAQVARLRALDPQGSIAVLVVAHAHALRVMAALARAGLATLGVDLVPLGERLVVRDLVQLTRALHDPADRAAWLAVLRAPWCGASLRTLSALSGRNDRELIVEALANPERLARCDRSDAARLARVCAVLTGALAGRGAESVSEWLERTWMRLGACDAYPADDLEDARRYFAALAQRDAAAEWRGPEDLHALLAELHAAPRAGENPVQVMTIHRAKGLEFDHVLIPALERTTRGGERRLLRWIDLPGESGESELLIAPTPAVGASEESEVDTYLRDLGRERDANERARLLYVAITRARRTLWLSAAPPAGDDGAPRPDPRSPLALLWSALAARFVSEAQASGSEEALVRAGPLVRLRADWQAAEPPAPVVVRLLPPAHVPAETPEFSWVRE